MVEENFTHLNIEVIKDRLFEEGSYTPVDLTEISDTEVDEFLIMETYTMDNPLSLALCNDDELMFEGLIRTYPIETLKKYVCNSLHFGDKQFQISEKNGVKYAILYYHYTPSTDDYVKRAMMLGGYYVMREIDGGGANKGIRKVIFEPKFQDEVTKKIKSFDVMYHITGKKNVERIKHIGLCSRSNCSLFNHPKRIYLLYGDVDENTIYTLAKVLSYSKYGMFIPEDYAVLTLNVDEFPEFLRFYVDPNHQDGVFTYGNIPPSCITKVEYFNEI